MLDRGAIAQIAWVAEQLDRPWLAREDFGRAVGGAVIDWQQLVAKARFIHDLAKVREARLDTTFFVIARNDD